MATMICIISGLFWALFDLSRKLSLNHVSPKSILIYFNIIQSVIFFIWVIYENFSINFLPYLFPGITLIILGVFSAIFFLKAIRDSELSLTIPLLSFTPFFSTIFSYIILDEKLTLTQYIGITSIIVGTLTLYSKNLQPTSILMSIKTIRNNLSARLMFIVAIAWSITPVLDKICLKHSSINMHGLVQSIGMIFFLVILSKNQIIKFKEIKKKTIALVTLTVIIGTIATILQFYAILLNYVPIMEAVKRSIGQFCAILFGNIFFKEKITSQRILGIILLSFGVLFIF